jgi:hypothetical protein
MKNLFWFYVIILAVAFAVIWFVVGIPNAELAPGSALSCTNRYDAETACFNLKYCKKSSTTTNEYAPIQDDGSCPKGFSVFTVTTQNMDSLCTMAKSMSGNNAATDPPACAPGCYDRGVSPYEDRISQALCCTAGTERTCSETPAPKAGGKGE